jgi:hypothetical protein
MVTDHWEPHPDVHPFIEEMETLARIIFNQKNNFLKRELNDSPADIDHRIGWSNI